MRTKTIYFLIDCSGSMSGQRADAVNNAMQKVVADALPEIHSQKAEDLDLIFAVYGFSGAFPTKVKVLMAKTGLDDFDRWDDLDNSLFNGNTPTGVGIQAIIDDFVNGDYGPEDPAPAIILISDGEPNDGSPSYDEVMEKAVKGNPNEVIRFRKSLRVAIGINVDDGGRQSLQKFGAVSDKMAQSGLKAYYDCSDAYTDQLVEIIKSATIMASVGAPDKKE